MSLFGGLNDAREEDEVCSNASEEAKSASTIEEAEPVKTGIKSKIYTSYFGMISMSQANVDMYLDNRKYCEIRCHSAPTVTSTAILNNHKITTFPKFISKALVSPQ